MKTRIFNCSPSLSGAREESHSCETLALSFHAEMKNQGYDCRVEKYHDYVDLQRTGRLTRQGFYSVTCREGPELARRMNLAEKLLHYIEMIELNNVSEANCPVSDPSGSEVSREEIEACEEISTWNATIRIEHYLRGNEIEEGLKHRLLEALVRAMEISIESDYSGPVTLNRNGVMPSRAFEILKLIGREEDGLTVPVLMKAIRSHDFEFEAIVALSEIAPDSAELEEARNILRPSLNRYVNGTRDPERSGTMYDLRIRYYSAISVIAPGSEHQRRAWNSICDGWDRYPDQPWVETYLGKLRPFCSQR